MVDEVRYCKARSKRSGERCNRPAMYGLNVCYNHGGATQASKRKNLRAKMENEMARFVKPVDVSHPQADLLTGLAVEWRRIISRIEFCGEQIAKLTLEQATWSKTKEEQINATEFAGRNTTYEAKISIWMQIEAEERKNLRDMGTKMVAAGIQRESIEANRQFVSSLDKVLTAVLTSLGMDVTDPALRAVVREAVTKTAPQTVPALESRK